MICFRLECKFNARLFRVEIIMEEGFVFRFVCVCVCMCRDGEFGAMVESDNFVKMF